MEADTNGEGTATPTLLVTNCHGNLNTAFSDQTFQQILQDIKSSKSPAVINYGVSCVKMVLGTTAGAKFAARFFQASVK